MDSTSSTAPADDTVLGHGSADRPRQRKRWLHWVPVLIAGGWLIASVVIGVGFIQEAPESAAAVTVETPELSASSSYSFYGGDAYTGIQNAASDTEHAVVDGVNGLAEFQLALEQKLAAQEARRWAESESRLHDALGFSIIGLGVLTFVVALGRATSSK